MHLLELLAVLGAALLASKVFGGLLQRLGIPSVLADLGMGIVLGNLGGTWGTSLAGALEQPEAKQILHALSELGVLFLLFIVGLETNLASLKRSGGDAVRVAVTGVVAPSALAFLILPWISPGTMERTLFLAAALSATSVGITARVLTDAGQLQSSSGQIILGAAVLDDILGVIILAVVSALVSQGGVSAGLLGTLFFKIACFAVGIWILRRWFLPRFIGGIRPFEVAGSVTVIALSLCLIASWAAEAAGLAGILGAFGLGVALDELHFHGYRGTAKATLEQIMAPVTEFLSPIFFLVIGMSVKLSALSDGPTLGFAAVLTACGIAGKLLAGLPVLAEARSRGADRWLIGMGMVPRGEVGLIFAGMGMQTGVLAQKDYNAVVAMVAVTTLLAPALMSSRLKKTPSQAASSIASQKGRQGP